MFNFSFHHLKDTLSLNDKPWLQSVIVKNVNTVHARFLLNLLTNAIVKQVLREPTVILLQQLVTHALLTHVMELRAHASIKAPLRTLVSVKMV